MIRTSLALPYRRKGEEYAFVVALAMRQQVQLYFSEPSWNEYNAVPYRARFRLDSEAVVLFLK